MDVEINTGDGLAASITKAASKQTYYTIRLFVDRDRVDDAYRAYGYFRWVDDAIDKHIEAREEKRAFVNRQRNLLEALYKGEIPHGLTIEEQMLAQLVRGDFGRDSGLRSYLHNMMAVMEFDVSRQGRSISQIELAEYTRSLSTAVTDAMFYFIGHDDSVPDNNWKYHCVAAAHITHMLRDMLEDVDMGYYNIPIENLQGNVITGVEVKKGVYREWVINRVQLAHRYFTQGGRYISQARSIRCRLVGYAYTARFKIILRAIEKDNYYLRREYPERKGFSAGIRVGWETLISLIKSNQEEPCQSSLPASPANVEDQ